jgi:uncharacterized protein DUF397
LTNENALEGDGDGWIVSSFSTDGGACVQVKFAGPGNVLVSDSKDGRPDLPIIAMPSRGWSSLLRDITSAS